MGKYILILLLVFISIPAFSPGSVVAQENPMNVLPGTDTGSKEACDLIKDNLKRGVDAKAVTKTNIQLGQNVCYVIKCAIDGGGELSAVIAGAVEAGSTADVVTKCCMDAGADPAKIARIFQNLGEGLGYSPPEGELVPMTPVMIQTPAGRSISPSAF
jgi:hypothetical protein